MNELSVINQIDKIEYKEMVTYINQELPIIVKEFDNFGKNQSQFMDNHFTVSNPTPLRNARQILSEINSRLTALKENQYKHQKTLLKIEKLKKQLKTEVDELEKQEIQLEIDYTTSSLADGKMYVDGAIRCLTNYIEQYKTILKNHNYDKITEEQFELEEEKYHIMKSFEQAICAARSRGGLVDEGNHIYFTQLGINGALAQHYITLFLDKEQEIIKSNGFLDSSFLNGFLNEMSEIFKGCSIKMAESKGMKAITTLSMIK